MTFDDFLKTEDFTAIKRHHVYKYAKKGTPLDDAEQIVYLGLWKACDSYDASKGVAFTTWLFRHIHYQYLRFMEALPPKLDYLPIGHDRAFFPKEDISEVVEGLPDRLRFVIERRTEGYTLGEIGSELGFSRNRIHQIEKQAIELIRKSFHKMDK